MRELTHKAGQSKIFVQHRRYQGWAFTSLYRSCKRCIAYWDLKADLRASVEVANFTPEYTKSVSLVIIDGGFKLFVQAFNEIKYLFLYSNEYGLDSNLSQRIRHGTLLGAIRALFDSFHLVTQKDSSGRYRDNAYWTNRLGFGEGPSSELAQRPSASCLPR